MTIQHNLFTQLLLLWCGLIQIGNAAPQPHLIKNINTQTTPAMISSLSPRSGFSRVCRDLVVMNNVSYFSANDSTHGNELWRSDGSAEGTQLVKDIWPDHEGSNPCSLTPVNGTLFFTANDGKHGLELWKSDGSVQGTQLVKNITTTVTKNSRFSRLFNMNGILLFFVQRSDYENILWKSDGTEAGTVIVKADPFPVVNASFTVLNNTLFFSAGDASTGGALGDELWKTDGTDAGTQVIDIALGSKSSYPTRLITFNNTLFFSALTPHTTVPDTTKPSGYNLWQSDGTKEGTQFVHNLEPSETFSNSHPENFSIIGNTLFFTASRTTDRSIVVRELWRIDNVSEGATRVKPLETGQILGMRNVNNSLFFHLNNALWRSNGTAESTSKIRDLPASFDTYDNLNTLVVGETLFFTLNRNELWKSDGTATGTIKLKDTWSSPISHLQNINGVLLFIAEDDTNGHELWRSDGTKLGTTLIKDISSGTEKGSSPQYLTQINSMFLFRADDGINGAELWASDGTTQGTSLLKDINSGANSSKPNNFVTLNNTLFFVADDGVNGSELWQSNGLESGTFLVKDIYSGSGGSHIQQLIKINDMLFFVARNEQYGRELWTSDGTEEGTHLVEDIWWGKTHSLVGELTNMNGVLFFRASNAEKGAELWRSDGTEIGTHMVKNIAADSDSDIPLGSDGSYPEKLTVVNNTLFFIANDRKTGPALWKSDGTEAGTVLVKIFYLGPPTYFSTFTQFISTNNRLFFIANDGIHGFELWSSDGTTAGTRIVKEIQPGNNELAPFTLLKNINGTLFFAYHDTYGGKSALWKSDGTEAGTVPIKEIDPSKYTSTLKINSTLFFSASTAGNGTQLWQSDGTRAGTTLIYDSLQSNGTPKLITPNYLTRLNGQLFFSAFDALYGTELWSVEEPSDANSTNIESLTTDMSGIIDAPSFQINKTENSFILTYAKDNQLFKFKIAKITQASSSSVSNFHTTDDGVMEMITHSNKKITLHPKPQELTKLTQYFSDIGFNTSHHAYGNLLFTPVHHPNKVKYSTKMSISSSPVKAENTGINLIANTSHQLTNSILFANQFYHDNLLFKQYFYPTPIHWDILKDALNLIGNQVSLNAEGIIKTTIASINYQGLMDYVVRSGFPQANALSFEAIGDKNGDGTVDFDVVYPNGDKQIIYIMP